MSSDDVQKLMVQFTQSRTPRVWSLLVTVFGELAQGQGAQISSSVLGHLCTLMGVKPEAMRVALHRLRKDGWIQSEKLGRSRSYALTQWGLSQSADASPKIYNLEAVPDHAWLVMCDPAQSARDTGIVGTWLSANALITATPPASSDCLATPITQGQSIPEWMIDRICPPEFVQLTAQFHDRLTQLQAGLSQLDNLDVFEISAIRILIVDGWRRIILKTPHLPAYIFPDTWKGTNCRATVTSLLAQYEKQQIDALEDSLTALS